MSAYFVAAAVVVAAATVYSSEKQRKTAKEANREQQRQNRIQAEAQANAAKINQEQQNKPVATIENSRASSTTQNQIRKRGTGNVAGSLNL